MKFTHEQLTKFGYVKNATGHYVKADGRIQNTFPQCNEASTLGCSDERKEDSANRITVRFILCKRKPFDPDNAAGSTKDLLDGLRYAGILHGDEAWRIKFEVIQEKVKDPADEKTYIEIIYPAGVIPPCLNKTNNAPKLAQLSIL